VRIAISSTTQSSATSAAAQQKSSSGGSSFEQLLNSASQTATPANATNVAAANQKPQQQQPSNQSAAQNQSSAQNTQNTAADQTTAQSSNQNTTTSSQPQQNTASLLQLKDELQNLPGQELSQQGTAVGSSTDLDTKTVAGSSTTPRPAAKQDKAQQTALSNAAAQAIVAVPVNTQVDPTASLSGQKQNNQQSGSTTVDATQQAGSAASAELFAAQVSAAAHAAPQAVGNDAQQVTDNAAHAASPAKPAKNDLIDADTQQDVSAAATNSQPATSAVMSPAGQNFMLSATLPLADAINGNGQGNPAITRTTAKDATAATKNPDLTSLTGSSSVASSSSSAGSASPLAATTQNTVPAVQHQQFDPSQVIVSKSADGGAATGPVQAVAIHGFSADTTAAHRTDSAAADTTDLSAARSAATTTSIADHIEAASGSGINTARVIQSMSESEMRVGMRSTEFGDISIRTSISQQQMVTQISLDHNDLSQAIAAHVSSVQAKLGSEYGLHAQIEVSQHGSSFSGDQGQSSPKEQKPYANSFRIDNSTLSSQDSDSTMSVLPLASVSSTSRLDIRA
jgi:hypothetical protein